MPVAVNCCVVPLAMLGLVGWTPIDTSVAAVTVSVVVAVTLPSVAVMSVVPAFTVLATPWLPGVLLMTAVVVAEEVHVTRVVRFCVDASE